MDRSGLLSAWWMPRHEETLWEMYLASAAQRLFFLTGIFLILNSLSHSLVKIFFDRSAFSVRDHVWIPHRIVEFLYVSFVFLYGLNLFSGWAPGDNSFLQDRVFAVSPYQELLANVQSAYSLYSIGTSVLNFKVFQKEDVRLIIGRSGFMLGMNYLYLLFPCVLSARLRIYWSVLEIALSVLIVTELGQSLKIKPKTLVMMSMASMLLCLIRFWLMMTSLMWAFIWVSSENGWGGIPRDVPVAELSNTYLTVTCIGAVGLCYMAFADFRRIIRSTKEWSEQQQSRTEHAE